RVTAGRRCGRSGARSPRRRLTITAACHHEKYNKNPSHLSHRPLRSRFMAQSIPAVQITSSRLRGPCLPPVDQETLARALHGRYTIERELGRGGMATVYLAADPRHSRRVALKVLNADLSAAV